MKFVVLRLDVFRQTKGPIVYFKPPRNGQCIFRKALVVMSELHSEVFAFSAESRWQLEKLHNATFVRSPFRT